MGHGRIRSQVLGDDAGAGERSGTLRLTDDAVIVERGGGTNAIPLRDIKTVFYKEPGLTVAYITFATEARDEDPGGVRRRPWGACT